MHHRLLRVLALICLIGLGVGCAGDRADVSGTVSLNGQPIEEGAITFIPIEGTKGPGTGGVISKGKYHIARSSGVVVGKNRVEIRAFVNTGRKVQDPTGLPGTLIDERKMAFPPEYNDNSKLVREVRAGSNTFDFDIEVSGKTKKNP